jgi:hypothetical protein
MIDYTPFCHYEEIVDYIPPKKDVKRGRIVGYLFLILYIAIIGWGIMRILQYGSVWLYIKYTIALTIIGLFIGVVFMIIHWITSPARPRLRANYASVIKEVIGFDFGDDFKLLFTGGHDYEEYLYIFSEESFEPLKKHLESIPDGKDDKTGRVVNHVYKGQQGEGFELVEDRRGGSVCGSVESIEVDYKERTLKHKFVIY